MAGGKSSTSPTTTGTKTPLHWAAERGDLKDLLMAVRQSDHLDPRDEEGQRPLHLSVKMGHWDASRWLVLMGANADAVDAGYRSPLHVGATQGHVQLCKFLIEHGAAVDRPEAETQRTPVHCAALNDQVEVLKLLLSHGAPVDGADSKGETALHMAARRGHGGVVDVLLKAKASVEVRDREGHTPVDVAREHHHGAIVKRLGSKAARGQPATPAASSAAEDQTVSRKRGRPASTTAGAAASSSQTAMEWDRGVETTKTSPSLSVEEDVVEAVPLKKGKTGKGMRGADTTTTKTAASSPSTTVMRKSPEGKHESEEEMSGGGQGGGRVPVTPGAHGKGSGMSKRKGQSSNAEGGGGRVLGDENTPIPLRRQKRKSAENANASIKTLSETPRIKREQPLPKSAASATKSRARQVPTETADDIFAGEGEHPKEEAKGQEVEVGEEEEEEGINEEELRVVSGSGHVYYVEAIRRMKHVPGKGWKALIKWRGYDENDCSWEAAGLMPRVLVERFRREHNLPEDMISPAAAGVEVPAAPPTPVPTSSSSDGKPGAASKPPPERPADAAPAIPDSACSASAPSNGETGATSKAPAEKSAGKGDKGPAEKAKDDGAKGQGGKAAKGKASGTGRRRAAEEEIEIEAILDVREQAGSWKEFHVRYKGNHGSAWLSEKVINPGLVRDFMLQHNKTREGEGEELPATYPLVADLAASSTSSQSSSNDIALPAVTQVVYRNPVPTATAVSREKGGRDEQEVDSPPDLSGKKGGAVPDVVVTVG